MGRRGYLLVALMLFVTARACARDADAILGKWLNKEKTAQVEIYKEPNGKYFGKIVWLKEPTYPANDAKGMAGEQKVDRENRDPQKRLQPILGLVILRDFVFASYDPRSPLDADDLAGPSKPLRWSPGRVYDPTNGTEFGGSLTLRTWETLDIRTYTQMPEMERRDTWTRVKGSTQ